MGFDVKSYIIWLSICLMVGIFGFKTGFGFLKSFFLSILLTPLIALIIIASRKFRKAK